MKKLNRKLGVKTIRVVVFFILRLSFILKLSVIFYTFYAAPSLKQSECRESFQGSIKKFVFETTNRSVEDFIKKYGGQKGYVQFSKNLKAEMSYIYQLASLSLKKGQMSRLSWQAFKGTAADFFELRGKLLNAKGELKEEHIGMKGYVDLAEQLYKGNMLKTFLNVSAVLDKGEMKRLGWRVFNGTAADFFKLSGKLLNAKGELNKEYIGMKGYVRFAKQHYQGDMPKTFINVSAVLDKGEMKRLGWKQFQGTTEDFFELRGRLLNAKGELREEYIGMEGYAALAEQFYKGNMLKTFTNVSAVLGKEEMKRLRWQGFNGKTDEFSKLRGRLFNDEGELRKEHISVKGYTALADQLYEGEMQKTYQNVSAALDKDEMKRLGWKQFQGTTEDFFELRGRLLNAKGELREEYIGMEGYAALADQLYKGEMLKTFTNVSAVLGGAESMKELGLGWKVFQGAADQYRELKKLFAAKSIEELRGRKGQEDAAETIFKKDIRRAYSNVSNLREELLGSREAFEQLNWEKK